MKIHSKIKMLYCRSVRLSQEERLNYLSTPVNLQRGSSLTPRQFIKCKIQTIPTCLMGTDVAGIIGNTREMEKIKRKSSQVTGSIRKSLQDATFLLRT